MIHLPDTHIRILEPVSDLDYFDTQTVDLPRSITPLDVWNSISAHPQPLLKLAFRIRDAVSSRFGVKKIGGFTGQKRDRVREGDRLDFFLVEYADDECLVLTERDSHLDVMTCISTEGTTATVTSSVRNHNVFGRLYMIPVGIAHRWIVRRMLSRLKADVSA